MPPNNQNINKSSEEGNAYMGIFGFFQKKGNLLSATQNMISELRGLVDREQIITKAEWGKVEKMLEHVNAVEEKIMQHSKLLNSIDPRDKRRLVALQAEFGDLEELRNAIQLLNEELKRLTELQTEISKQMLERSAAKIDAIEQARLDAQPPESEEVKRILDAMRRHGKKK